MDVGYQTFQAGSPDGYLDFGVISTPEFLFLLLLLVLLNRLSVCWGTMPRRQSSESLLAFEYL